MGCTPVLAIARGAVGKQQPAAPQSLQSVRKFRLRLALAPALSDFDFDFLYKERAAEELQLFHSALPIQRPSWTVAQLI